MFTWTIDAGYPHETETCDFYFAETKVQITNMPAKFDQAFKHWTAKGEKRQEALAELFQGTPFDVALAFDAMDKSTGEWGKVWDGFSDRFKLYQLLTIQLGGIMFCRFWPRITIKLASSVMILAAGVMIRLSSSKEVMNFVRDFSQPRSASTWILCIGMVVCDLLEPWLDGTSMTLLLVFSTKHRDGGFVKCGFVPSKLASYARLVDLEQRSY